MRKNAASAYVGNSTRSNKPFRPNCQEAFAGIFPIYLRNLVS
jgi:hypothetical protein